MKATPTALLALLATGCIFRLDPDRWNDKDDDEEPQRPDDSDPLVDDTSDTDTDVMETDEPEPVCPPELPLDAIVVDGRAQLNRDASAGGNEDLYALITCCVPSDLYVSQGLGHIEVSVDGPIGDVCAFDVLVEVEMGWSRYACRKDIPVELPPGLDSPLASDAVGTDPFCVLLGSGGPFDTDAP